MEQNSKRPKCGHGSRSPPEWCRGRVPVNFPDRRRDQGKLAGSRLLGTNTAKPWAKPVGYADNNVLKPLKQRLWHLSIIVAIAAWQAYTAFDRFFTLTTEEMANRSNEVWFSIGPISLFLASALGLLFALGAVTTKHQTGKNFWSALLWVPTGWLAAGALVFLPLDWFGQGLHSS